VAPPSRKSRIDSHPSLATTAYGARGRRHWAQSIHKSARGDVGLSGVHEIVISKMGWFFLFFENGAGTSNFKGALAAILMILSGSAYTTEYLQNGSLKPKTFRAGV
jgi:hypothetical protein